MSGAVSAGLFTSYGSSPYALAKSVTLNGSSQYLSWTSGASPTSDKKWTISLWVKKVSNDTSGHPWFSGQDSAGSDNDVLEGGGSFGGTTNNQINLWYGGGSTLNVSNNAPITDTTTWHHVVVAYDSTQATAANRVRIYVDGAEVTYGSTTYPSSNQTNGINVASKLHTIGKAPSFSIFANIKVADVQFVDGQQLTAASFATGNGSGPKLFSGVWGANGFHLKFDGSDGTDTSGNGNTWTVNNSPTFSSDVPT